MSPTLSAHGVTVSLPSGFEGRVFRRPAAGEVGASVSDGPPAPPAEVPNTVMHVTTIALPPGVGDFASGAVDRLSGDDVLVVLFEYGPASVGQPLFRRVGMPKGVVPDDFSPSTLQRTIPGQAGCQFFFSEQDRAFCLYAVIGSYARRNVLTAKVNAVLATVQIDPLVTPSTGTTTTTTPPGNTTPTTTPTTTTPPTTTPPTTSTQPLPPPTTSTQ